MTAHLPATPPIKADTGDEDELQRTHKESDYQIVATACPTFFVARLEMLLTFNGDIAVKLVWYSLY